MTTPIWTGGTLKLPGDLVQPASVAAVVTTAIANPGFETGTASGWTLGANMSIAAAGVFEGAWALQLNTGVNTGPTGQEAVNATEVPVIAGQGFSAQCYIHQGASNVGQAGGYVRVKWYDAAHAFLSNSDGNNVKDGTGGAILPSSVNAVAPANAKFARIAGVLYRVGENFVTNADAFSWTYTQPAAVTGLVYKAVQAAAGTTAASEPIWPTTLGVQVIDGGVTWEATQASRVTWTAHPVLLAGTVEPIWPTVVGGSVVDGSIVWEAVSRHVADPKCPHSKFVKIIANKVYAGDGDIIRYSATANPLDWSTADDAGYLPYGLNPHGASPLAALGEYRSNLVGLNAGGMQMWQVDEDPANAALLDAMPIGSTWHRALFSVGDDLFLLTQKGVRTIGIAGANASLASGQDVGEPIDPLVLDAIRVAEANSSRVVATYSPAEGQYMLAVSDYPPAAPEIAGDLPDGVVGDSGTLQYAVSGGVLPYSAITVTSGSLPPGATMAASGLVTYAYTTAGSYAWTVGGTDADGTLFTMADTVETGFAGIFAAVDNQLSLQKSSDGGATFPDAVATGLPTASSEVCVQSAGGRLFHLGVTTEGRSSADGVSFVACTGLSSPSGYGPGSGTIVKVGTEWQLYHYDMHVSTDGVAFSLRTLTTNGVKCPAVLGTTILAVLGGQFLQVSTNSGVTFASYNASATLNATEGVQRLLAVPSVGFLLFGRDASGYLMIGTSATGASGSWVFESWGVGYPPCHGVSRNPSTGRVVIVLQDGASFYTDDNGAVWNACAAVPYAGALTFPSQPVNNMIFASGAFFFCARQLGGVNRVYSSPDGVSAWVSVYSRSDANAIESIAEFTP